MNRFTKFSNLLREIIEDFQELRRIVRQDSALQKELQKISSYEEFVSKVVEIGREKGLNVENEEVWEAIRESRRVLDRKMDLKIENFRDWSPLRIYEDQGKLFVDWVFLQR